MTHYSDDALEYWGDIFTSRNMSHYGYTFEQFLTNPHCAMQHAAMIDDLQEIADDLAIENHGEIAIQPMHKRATPRAWKVGRNKKMATPLADKRRVAHGGVKHA